ncbi:Aim41 [Kluyveromyces lactis]|nr:Aim41 [Kluyveromyces lactis]
MLRCVVPSVRATAMTRAFVRFASSQGYIDGIAALKQDLKKAMLAKDNLRKTTIRGVLSTIKNKEIDSKDKDLDEFVLYDVYAKLISQRKDSIAEFVKNKREDLVEKEASEIKILENYQTALPVASREEVDARVVKILTDLKESEPSLQLKQVFGKIDWKTLPGELKASPAAIRSSISSQFKKVFQ